MFTQVNKQLQYYYNQAKSKQKTKQEILTILNRKKSTLDQATDRLLTPNQTEQIVEKFDEMIALVNRLPD